jgi:hypothetical protein
MAISPQDKNKVIGLVAGVVVVFAFAFWRISSSMTSNAPATAQPIVLTPPAGSTGGATAPVGGQVVEIVLPMSAGRVDPFRTVLSKETGSTGPVNPPYVPPSTGNQGPPNMTGDLEPFKVGTVSPDMSVEPRLVGIMSGDKPLAVFQIGGKEEIVKVGGTVTGGYVLATVLGDVAILTKNGKTLRLSMASPK